MAALEYIRNVPLRFEVENGVGSWGSTRGRAIQRLPQLIWAGGSTWSEVNLWALEQAREKNIKTVRSVMSHMLGYAKWLEGEQLDWWHFPARASERCLLRFRGDLVRARDRGEIAPSTASIRMAAVIRFYRWLLATGLLTVPWPLWNERKVGIRLTDAFGFEHTLRVTSTDLAIPNRAVAGAIRLEDGVMPLTTEGMRQVREYVDMNASLELALMLRVGFETGLRLDSILDLKVETLERTAPDPIAPSSWYRIALGPAAKPPVRTKGGVSGMVPIPKALLSDLKAYATSTRRLKRQADAAQENRDLVFLTRFGNPYSDPEGRAVNVEMSRLRAAAVAEGIEVFRDFHFHRTRATFATLLMRAALGHLEVADAVAFVREACLHKNEATTLKYVKFIETSKAMAEAADQFTREFMGLVGEADHEPA